MSLLKNKLHGAVVALTGTGNVKSRLCTAWVDHLADLPDSDVPETLRDVFESLRERLHTELPVNGEPAVVATIRKMSADDAGRCAEHVVHMFTEALTDADNVQLRLVDLGETAIDEAGRSAVPGFLFKH
jgi:hypothetical protein